MPKKVAYYYLIARPHRDMQWTGFLDMMRYDRAMIEDHSPTWIILSSTYCPPTEARWASLGIPIMVCQSGYLDRRTMLDTVKDRLPS